jgi:hypothetical protein
MEQTLRVKADIYSFCKAVGAGTLAGGGPYLFFTLPLAVGDFFSPLDGKANVFRDLYLALLPLLVALVVVLAGSTLIGIPTALILRRGTDKLSHYVFVGVTAGVLIPLFGLRMAGAEWGPAIGMSMFGAVSGGITALTWSKATQSQKA